MSSLSSTSEGFLGYLANHADQGPRLVSATRETWIYVNKPINTARWIRTENKDSIVEPEFIGQPFICPHDAFVEGSITKR